MRNKIIDFHKIFKKIDNITFWVFFLLAFVLFFGSITFIWMKCSSIAELSLLTNEIKDIFSKLVLVNIVVYSLGVLINLYHFNNAVPKIIKKDHLVSTNVTKSIILISCILLFISSKVFLGCPIWFLMIIFLKQLMLCYI